MKDHTRRDTLSISDVMTTDIITTTQDSPVEEVAHDLRHHGFGGLPVVDDDGILIGIVSEFDVISKSGRTAGEIMTRNVISVGDETGADQVTALMGVHGIRRVPVVRDGRIVGIVTRSDLLKLYTLARWDCQTCGDYMRGFAKPETCPRCGSSTFTLVNEQRVANG
jgi:CBS domain-containing protein